MSESESTIQIRIIDTIDEFREVVKLQAVVWPGDPGVPDHMMRATNQNGGLTIGAFDGNEMVGFAYGFPGIFIHKGNLNVKHCSHQVGVHPDYRDGGLGFRLKRAQWQLVRQQGLDLITWTYDPLESRNAYLNISKLGAICQIYHQNEYGDMRDALNLGIPSDRFEVEWWVNSRRVMQRLDKQPRKKLNLTDYLAADVEIINPAKISESGLPIPEKVIPETFFRLPHSGKLIMLEFPANYQNLKTADRSLALEWRLHTRELFERLFSISYLVSDFVYDSRPPGRSYYVLSDGEATLD